MAIEFDPAKNVTNIAKYQITGSCGRFRDSGHLPDTRFNYGEARFRAWGLIDGEAHCLAFITCGDKVRAISLRQTHAKEIKPYGASE